MDGLIIKLWQREFFRLSVSWTTTLSDYNWGQMRLKNWNPGHRDSFSMSVHGDSWHWLSNGQCPCSTSVVTGHRQFECNLLLFTLFSFVFCFYTIVSFRLFFCFLLLFLIPLSLCSFCFRELMWHFNVIKYETVIQWCWHWKQSWDRL